MGNGDTPRPAHARRAAHVVALVAGRAERARIAGALSRGGHVTFAGNAEELRAAVQCGCADVVLLEPRCPVGRDTGPLIRYIREAFPDVPVLAYCDPQTLGSGQIVEIVRAERTADAVFETAFELGGKLGKTPIRCSDTPGFVVNRVLIPLLNDCVRVLDEAGVTPEDLDAGMRHGAGWPVGPCALLDLVGADVHVHASEALYEKLREPRMAPPARLVRMLAAGKLGRKTGEGFYVYD